MQSFGEHGRELITPEVGLRLLEMLGQLGLQMEHSASSSFTPQQNLLQRTVFKVSQCCTSEASYLPDKLQLCKALLCC